jgi:Rrf2 family protein
MVGGTQAAAVIANRSRFAGTPMFSSTTEYALRAAVYLASLGGEAANSERIAARTKVPSGYISKVMRDLVRAGLVDSQRGPNGGFTLARPPGSIAVLEVVNSVAPLQRITHCPLGNPAHVNLCPLHRRLDDAIASIQATFASTTLAQLLESGEKAAGASCTALTIEGSARSTGGGAVPKRAKG